jgi:GNAT superfamily N-acetyltransferase
MSEEYSITSVDRPPWDVLGPGIRDFNESHAGPDKFASLCLVLTGPDDQIVGGLAGATYWDWFYIDVLWVREELRGQGYGRRLLALAEQEARQRGAKSAYLDTFSFQAPDFYMRHGYQVFGELPDFPAGHRRYFMTKQL